ncbi:MAG: hypothetical protein HKO65_15385 [Gemmatimonadetes bacterium]|nr:hypothetical protein [Gemmatimonadota bacterium]NNM06475.1 hypothetical protein [Gemmatimonadota bacterium]
MEVWIERVRVILDRAPTRAMPLSHLLQSLEGVGGNRKEIGDWILKTMKGKEESFRVIPDRLGPWVWRMSPGGSSASIPAMARQDPDPWVLIRSPASRSSEPEERVFGQIRECLGAWGEAVDTGSQTSVACWIGANREAERALARLATPERIPA